MVIFERGSAYDDLDDDPTPVESNQDTAPHDMTALARAMAARDDATRTARHEGREEVFAALYAVMRQPRLGLKASEQDAIVLAVRARLPPISP